MELQLHESHVLHAHLFLSISILNSLIRFIHINEIEDDDTYYITNSRLHYRSGLLFDSYSNPGVAMEVPPLGKHASQDCGAGRSLCSLHLFMWCRTFDALPGTIRLTCLPGGECAHVHSFHVDSSILATVHSHLAGELGPESVGLGGAQSGNDRIQDKTIYIHGISMP